MPLKSFQLLLVFAYGARSVHLDHKDTLFDFGWPGNTERSDQIPDGVQSQATTSWIYSQGTTADHMYV